VQQRLDFLADVVVFELELPALAVGRLPAFQPLSKFPAMRRDLSLVVSRKINSAQLITCIKAAQQEVLQDILLFDVYTGDTDPDQKSVGIGLILQGASHTLSDVEVNAVVADVLQRLENDFGAILRAA
jgi:phenylalanyl-tRNA synthetase beta chain